MTRRERLLLALLLLMTALAMPARWFPSVVTSVEAVGSLAIPNTIGAQSGPTLAASLLDANWSAIATYVNAREISFGLCSARPAAGTAGRWYFCNDPDTPGLLAADTGTAWQQVGFATESGVNLVRNLVGTPGDSAGANTLTQYSVLADLVTLRNPQSGIVYTMRATSTLTNNTATAGPAANGRDRATGFSDSDRFIHLYYITNGSTVATLSSTCSTTNFGAGQCSIYGGPTLPTGYHSWAYVGAIPWGGTFLLSRIRGPEVCYQRASRVLTNGNAIVETAVALASVVSANAQMIQMRGQLDTGGGAAGSADVRYISNNTFTSLEVINTGGGVTTVDTQAFWIPNEAQSVIYILSNGANALDLDVLCYRVPNGG